MVRNARIAWKQESEALQLIKNERGGKKEVRDGDEIESNLMMMVMQLSSLSTSGRRKRKRRGERERGVRQHLQRKEVTPP